MKMSNSLPKIDFESSVSKSPKFKCTCMNKVEKENRKPSTTNEDILKNQITDIKNQLNSVKYENDKLKSDLDTAKIKEDNFKQIIANLEIEKQQLEITSKAEHLHKENETLHSIISSLKTELENNKKHEETSTKTNVEVDRLHEENKKLNYEISVLKSKMKDVTLMAEKAATCFEAELDKVIKEREITQKHLDNAESAFSDVHQKYESCKQQVLQLKKSDQALRKDIEVNEDTIQRLNKKYDSYKTYAINQMDAGNVEFCNTKKHYEADLSKLNAQLKRYEIKCNSLMLNLQQKTKENEELASAFDEMIGQVN